MASLTGAHARETRAAAGRGRSVIDPTDICHAYPAAG